ncbi:MAG: hypothetical protein ACOX87_02675 [Chloroflexota bacterium]
MRSLVLLLFILAMALVGCQSPVEKAKEAVAEKITEKAIEQVSGGDIEKKGENVTFSKDGESLTVGSDLPEELKGFPIPKDFKIVENSFSRVVTKNEKAVGGRWTGPGTMESVGEFYASAMPQQGWSQVTALDSATASLRSYTRDGWQVNVSWSKQESEIALSISMTNKPLPTATPAKPTATPKPTSTPKPTATPKSGGGGPAPIKG